MDTLLWYSVKVDGQEVLSTQERDDARVSFERARAAARFGTQPALSVSLHYGDSLVAEWEAPEESDAETLLAFLEESRGWSGDVYLVSAGWRVSQLADELDDSGGGIEFSQLENIDRKELRSLAIDGANLVYVPPACSGSDYNGGSVARANIRALSELEVTHYSVSGGHGSQAIAFPLWIRNEELLSALRGLENYPVVDEDVLSHQELEEEDEAWENVYSYDFKRELERTYGVDLDGVAEEKVRELFHSLMEREGTYFEHHDDGPHIDVERLVDATDRAELMSLDGAVSTTAEEENRAERLFRMVGAELPKVEGDRLPLLEAWERTCSELRAEQVLDCSSEGDARSLLVFARDVGGWPLSGALPPDASLSEVRNALDSLRETVLRVRDVARATVLPFLVGKEQVELASRWERDSLTGKPVSEAFRENVLSLITAEGRRRGLEERKTCLLRPYAREEERIEELRKEGKDVREVAQEVLRERVRSRLTREGSRIWMPSGQKWAKSVKVSEDGKSVELTDDSGVVESVQLEELLAIRHDF